VGGITRRGQVVAPACAEAQRSSRKPISWPEAIQTFPGGRPAWLSVRWDWWIELAGGGMRMTPTYVDSCLVLSLFLGDGGYGAAETWLADSGRSTVWVSPLVSA